MSDRQSGPTRAIKAVTDAVQHPGTFTIGVSLLIVWVLFMGAGVAVALFTTRQVALPLWIHAPGALGATLAAPGSLSRVASAWKDARK